ncbi:MAG TPA: hypothetical protein VFV62_03440 [Gaiellaceae bacterium]|nr:hypothetical protein [Gaiellaceae bacterium]
MKRASRALALFIYCVRVMYEQRDAEKDLRAARDSSSEIRLRLGMRVMKARDQYLRASKVSDLAVAARDAAVKAYDRSVAGS